MPKNYGEYVNIQKIKSCIKKMGYSKVLSVYHCGGPHFQIKGGPSVVNVWPKSYKMHVSGRGKAVIFSDPKEVVVMAIGNLFANGPVTVHKGPRLKTAGAKKRPTRKPATQAATDLFGCPMCLHCKKHITISHEISFDNGRMIHAGCAVVGGKEQSCKLC